MVRENIENALEELRPALASDGFDLGLESVDDDSAVTIALKAQPNACIDCLLPDDVLLAMLEQSLRKHVPSISRIELRKYLDGLDTGHD